MKCTILMNNKSLEGFHSEHGLSFYIEVEGQTILLDAGSSGKFIENAKKLSISMDNLDYAVISHGHFDHSDGFRSFFEENKTTPVYLRETATDSYFSFSSGSPKFVGIHKNLDSSRFQVVNQTIFPICPHLFLVAQPNSVEETRKEDEVYKIKLGFDQFIQDSFTHQQSVVIPLEHQLVIFNSCSHGNIVEIVQDILEKFPNYSQFTLVGGLHLLCNKEEIPVFSPDSVLTLANKLKELGLNTLYTGHCTSDIAFTLLQDVLKTQVIPFYTGESFEIN